MWGNQSVGFAFASLKAIGSTSGILVMWDKNTFHSESSSCGDFSVTCIFQMVGGNFSRAFTSVYGLQAGTDKLRMWEESLVLELSLIHI